MQVLTRPIQGINSLAVSPDSRYLATGGNGCYVWDLWDPETPPRKVGNDLASDVHFASATRLVVGSASADQWWRYDTATGGASEFELLNEEGGVYTYVAQVALHPSGDLIKVKWVRVIDGSYEDELATYRLTADGFELLPPTESPACDGLMVFAFRPQGDSYAARASETVYNLRDTVSDKVVTVFTVPPGYDDYFDFETFSPDGHRVFARTQGHLLGFDCATGGGPVAVLTASEGNRFRAIACHPQGHIVATVENISVSLGVTSGPPYPPRVVTPRQRRRTGIRKRNSCVVTLRDVVTLHALRAYDFELPSITCVAFTPDGTRCVVGSSRGKVLLFDLE